MSTRKVNTIPGRRTRAISRQTILNPAGGLNNNGSPSLIDDKQWADLLNIQFDEGGVARKRMGFTSFAGTLTSAHGLGALKTSSVNNLVTIDNTTFKYYAGSAWAAVSTISFTANLETSFTQARSKVYIWNGTDGGAEWDGTTLARPGTMPSAKFSVFYNGYHVAGGTGTQTARLYFSDVSNASTFTSSGTFSGYTWDSTNVPGATVFNTSGAQFIDISPGDGEKITGLGIFSDTLIVFKENSVYQLSLTFSGSTMTPSVLPITKSTGCVASRSIVNVENDLYFLSREGVRVLGNQANYFNSIRTSIISRNIDPTIQSIKSDSYDKSTAVYFNKEYILNVPDSSGNITVTLSYHREFQAWSIWSNINADSMIKYIDSNNNQRLIFNTETGTQMYEFTPGVYTDNGVAITSYLLSKVFDFKNPDITKYFVDLGLIFRTISGEVNLEIFTQGNVLFGGTVGIGGNTVTDGMGITVLGYSVLGTGGGTVDPNTEAFADLVKRIMIKTKSTSIRFRIENDRNNENFVLLGFIHAFYPYSHYFFDSDSKIYL
jgi:hypothetical protein